MAENESMGSFFNSNKSLAKEYLETRLEIFRLSAIRIASKSMGYFAWLIISLFLIFLIILFLGITLGFWISRLTDSYIKGFGIITVALTLLFVILTVFRKKLFQEPLMQVIINKANEEIGGED
jgi:hypothetical protein